MRPGELPDKLKVGNQYHEIDTDYRNVLQIVIAMNDEKLTDRDKAYICLRRLYKDISRIQRDDYQEAYEKASEFISCGMSGDRGAPNIVSWEKDQPLIFPEINKVAGCEVRALPYMHWWTFLGYFQAVDREGLWGSVLTIRQKRAKGKKLEKYEKEFMSANKSLISMKKQDKNKNRDPLKALFDELSADE